MSKLLYLETEIYVYCRCGTQLREISLEKDSAGAYCFTVKPCDNEHCKETTDDDN